MNAVELRKKFDLDLKKGLAIEALCLDILSNKTVEVKNERLASDTKHVAVEFKSFGKPSGIAVTEADYWCFVLGGDFKDNCIIFIDTKALVKIARFYYNKGSITKGGDSMQSEMVLVPLIALTNTMHYREGLTQ